MDFSLSLLSHHICVILVICRWVGREAKPKRDESNQKWSRQAQECAELLNSKVNIDNCIKIKEKEKEKDENNEWAQTVIREKLLEYIFILVQAQDDQSIDGEE